MIVKKLLGLLYTISYLLSYEIVSLPVSGDRAHYYCIPSDEKHFHLLKNLIGSVHHADCQKLGEIAVFNVGLTEQQIDELNSMFKVKVYAVEMTHPDLLSYFTTSPSGRQVRGYFAWKPVVIKQALELFPHVLYLDAGTTVLQPLDDLFVYIREHGYFLMSCTHTPTCNIVNRITKKVIDDVISTFDETMQAYLLTDTTTEIDAGLQGVSRCASVRNYLMPVYEASKNLDLFKDDGSALYGYGQGRHDQILFSIYAHALSLVIHNEGYALLSVAGNTKRIHIHWDSGQVNQETIIYRSRHDIHFQGGKTQYINYGISH